MKSKKNRLLAWISVAAMAVSYIPVSAKETGSVGEPARQEEGALVEQYPAREGVGRTQVNFNRNWKFIRSDVKDAFQVEYDDSDWVDVGLPHNFSIPYEMSSQFYVGYGWYRKAFEIPAEWEDKKIELEFEGVFQVAEVYVNGELVGTHEGGYSGFVYDITDNLRTGNNVIAVRVNNIWQHDLAPRTGDHQFTGGIYRDVYLNVTEAVHVTWYGTFVTTPDLINPGFDESAENIDFSQYPTESEIMENIEQKRSNVRVQTEVVNDSDTPKEVQVLQQVCDKEGQVVTEFASEEQTLEAGEMANFDALSEQIQGIELWSPEHPYVYTVHTYVICDGQQVDSYESPLGFRWAQYRNDAFYLNGEKVLLNGANAHQDHAGFADAVTDEGLRRDVAMIKECGMNFIRGSHYPHDPSYAQACDELGLMFWSECNFWGMGGNAGKDADPVMNASDWFKDAYPQNPEDEAAFEQSCMDSLEAMIRVNRNHPSIINWSMGNEVFFTDDRTQNKAKALVDKMRDRAHQLDPTRKAGMGGCQREGYDSLKYCDIAGYNGDGGKFQNHTMPNFVAEYGSKVQDRPGEFRPFYDQIQGGSAEEYVLQPNSAGLALWCAFHHGTIGGDGLAKMGMIDYYRLPTNSWYWYRKTYTGVEPEFSLSGTAASMEISTSDTTVTNDGKKDTQLIVTMKDAEGNWVDDNREVTLTVEEGPGIFPGGKTYIFQPGTSIRDGKASMEFRSYYEGTTVIRASAEGLPDATITIQTENVTGVEDGEEPENFYNADLWGSIMEKVDEPFWYGANNAATSRPVFPSSNKETGELATDGDLTTSWVAAEEGNGQYFEIDLEVSLYLYKLSLGFETSPCPFKVETALDRNEEWTLVAEYTKDTVDDRPVEESLDGVQARYVRVTFTEVPEGEKAFLSELEVYGNPSSQAAPYTSESVYLSDVVDYSTISTGWQTPGKNVSCEGNPIRVGGITYEKGIGVHANSSVTYRTEEKYTRIAGVAGIDNEVTGGNAIFRIYADNMLIYEKELSGGQKDEFDLSISGVAEIRLMTDSNGVDSEDHTDWADVRLYGAIRDISSGDSKIQTSYVGMSSGLHAGERFQAVLGFRNQTDQPASLRGLIAWYDKDGQLRGLDTKSAQLEPDGVQNLDMSVDMPKNITGCYGKLFVWNEQTCQIASDCIFIEADPHHLSSYDPNQIQWKKVDGEDSSVEKTGTWTLWESQAAYQGTETCCEDASGASYLTYVFEGSYVRIGAKIDSSQVGADVYIDGRLAGHMDTDTQDTSVNVYQQVFSSEELDEGSHTLKIVPAGKFGLDYIETGVKPRDPEPESEPEKQELLHGLEEVMKELLNGSLSSYSQESRNQLLTIFTGAAELCKDQHAEAADYLESAADLKEAVERLEKPREVDRTNLYMAVQMAEKLKKTGQEFTQDSWEAVEEALSVAKSVLDRADATQDEVDDAYYQLLNACLQLEDGVRKSGLAAAIKAAETILGQEEIDQYTEESVQKVKDVLAEAKKVYGAEYTEPSQGQAAVTAVTERLITAVTGLLKKQEPSEEPGEDDNDTPRPPDKDQTKPPISGGENETPGQSSGGSQEKAKVPKKGTVKKVGKLYYKVTKSAAGGGTVSVVRPASRRYKNITVPGTVKLNGYSFRVTAIAAKAFRNNQKLVSVRTGSNVSKIGKLAFAGCKNLKRAVIGKRTTTIGAKAFFGDGKLKNIKIVSKNLKKVEKQVFRNIHKKAMINVPNKLVRKYRKKVLKKSGRPATTAIK